MNNDRIGLGVTLGAAALALGLGTAVGRAIEPRVSAARETKPAATTETTASAATTTSSAPKRYMVPVSDTQPHTGAAEAIVTIVEWCDLPNAACAALEPGLQQVLKEHPDTVRLVSRHYDQPDHPGSRLAHSFARAAHEQAGKFWQARALLLAQSSEFTLADAERYSNQLGLDWKSVREAIQHDDYATSITADHVFASMFDIHEVPALFVNGRSLGDRPSIQQLRQLVDDELTNGGQLLAQGIKQADIYAELTKKGAWNKPNLRQQ